MKRVKLLHIIICILFFLPVNAFTQTRLIKKVVLDAGHGGKDPGACAKNVYEKDITLSVVLKLGKFIQDNFKDVEVVYTRKTDEFIELYNRASIANQHKADLFISVHCNSNGSADPYGFETYVMGPNKNKANIEVAKKENASILLEDNYSKKYDGFDPNSPEADVVFTLYQNAFLEQSLSFSVMVQKEFKERLKRFDRGVKQAGFWVLCKTTMPSVLVEAGFISNPDEERFIATEQGQIYIASAMYKAFKEYKAKSEGTVVKKDEHDKLEVKETPKAIVDTAKQVKVEKKEIVEPESKKDIVITKKEHKDEKQPSKEIVVDPKKETVASKKTETVKKSDKTLAEKMATQPKPTSEEPKSTKKPTVVNEVTDVPIFKVQILNSAKKIEANSPDFKGLKGIDVFQDGGLFKYTIGAYPTLNEASVMSKKMKETGFEGAFIVAFLKNKKISLDEARKLIKQ